jgi:uncharacterized protein (DUF1810 family)
VQAVIAERLRGVFGSQAARIEQEETMLSPSDPFDLARFVEAQEADYYTALTELRAGRKRSHWIWYIFPQYAGFASSSRSKRYAIKSRAEASAYVQHPVLGPRIEECAKALLAVKNRSAREILGDPDDLKVRSCATLFALVLPPGNVMEQVLDKYYEGAPDVRTLELMGER